MASISAADFIALANEEKVAGTIEYGIHRFEGEEPEYRFLVATGPGSSVSWRLRSDGLVSSIDVYRTQLRKVSLPARIAHARRLRDEAAETVRSCEETMATLQRRLEEELDRGRGVAMACCDCPAEVFDRMHRAGLVKLLTTDRIDASMPLLEEAQRRLGVSERALSVLEEQLAEWEDVEVPEALR